MDDEKALWKKCAEFHGHECGGLTIGYKAALYAKELLDLDFSEDEQVVCISENDACGVDAIQVILGCSVGKGNLLFHICGKQAFSFYDRGSGRSVRLVLKEKPREMTKAEGTPNTGIPFFLFFYDVTNTECKNCQYDKYNNNICHVNPPFQLIKRRLCLQLLVRMNTQICYKCCYYQHCNQSANKACSKRTCCN